MSVSPALFLSLVSLICVGVFLIGLRFARMTHNPWAGKTLLGQPIEGHDLPLERIHLFGKVSMILAPVFFLAVCFLVLTGKIEPMTAAWG